MTNIMLAACEKIIYCKRPTGRLHWNIDIWHIMILKTLLTMLMRD